MAMLYEDTKKERQVYVDRRFPGGEEERKRLLGQSKTLYVGNLSFYTTEEQIYELFRKAGPVRRIVMGLDRHRKTPCGFCFVEYTTRTAAQHCVWFVSGTKLDHRTIRVDWDIGFADGRQYGRGRSGGQVRDEYREDFDPDRGGYGKQVAKTQTGQEMWGAGADEAGRGTKRHRHHDDRRSKRPRQDWQQQQQQQQQQQH